MINDIERDGADEFAMRPVLALGAVHRFEAVRGRHVLLTPEKAEFLDDIALRILEFCDGRTIAEICGCLADEFDAPADVIRSDVLEFIRPLIQRRTLVALGSKDASPAFADSKSAPDDSQTSDAGAPDHPVPIGLLAELTHSCPLKCVYCSNPVALTPRESELSTADWARVFTEAAELGVLQLHLSGGEPALRKDLDELIRAACEAGLYTNLITSGLGITEQRMNELAGAGLHHVQLSFQGTDETASAFISGANGAVAKKRQFAGWVRAQRLPLTLNAPVHRHNLHQLEEFIDLAVELDAERIEIAHVQYYAWALQNRAHLMPSTEQVRQSIESVEAAREKYAGRLTIDFVTPDYHARYPKACMGGWGRSFIAVGPEGKVMPCHAAHTILGLEFETVLDKPLADIWRSSSAFNAFRGTGWMQEPCASCPRKEIDWGGCRCQALAITGDAAATDPVCHLSPHNAKVESLAQAGAPNDQTPITYRSNTQRATRPDRS